MVLLENLPPESAFRRTSGGWTLDEYLLASIADATRARVWQAGGGKGQKPKPIPRPGDKPDTEIIKGTAMTLEEAQAFKAKQAGIVPGGCTRPGCAGKHKALGLCAKHYGQDYRRRKAVTDGS